MSVPESRISEADTMPSSKVRCFQAVTIAHPHLLVARQQLMAAITDGADNSLIFVLGPTGVGKTTLRAKIENEIAASCMVELQGDKGRLPVVSVEAVAPESGNFNWKEHFKRLLEEMREPLIEHKLDCKEKSSRKISLPIDVASRNSGAEYQYAVEQALRYRRPTVVLIDEAQHLAKMSSGRRVLDQLDVIKSIANRLGTPHILVGTYDLLAFRNLNGQLSRRSSDVHFRRYRADRAEEAAIFVNVVRSLAAQMPFPETPDLAKEWEYLYERSIGCVGVLKTWLVKTLSVVLREGRNTMKLMDLESCALSVSQCEKMLSECIEGENRMSDGNDNRLRLRSRLGLPQHEGTSPKTISAGAVAATGGGTNHRNRWPGRRRATRDVIGAKAVHAG
jgi:hypothetical protein